MPNPEPGAQSAVLAPFLPRVVLDWLADEPERRWRSLDATVVFVDVSGFTRLSERLARGGRVGAETLTEVISGCFAHLLEGAYDEGGSLLKFGGDALLLLFFGADHTTRACRAAHAMRARLADVALVDAPGGRVRLRMSVGVHTGEFLLFLVGRSHRELVIAGPAASETVTMEHHAEAGEILISPAVASQLPRSCVGGAKGPGFRLRRAPQPAAVPMPAPAAASHAISTASPAVDLAEAIPVGLRAHLLAQRSEPEHRIATVGFVHFDGTDVLAAAQGPAALATALDELVTVAADAAEEQGVVFLGSDIDHDGGKIILAAAVPLAVGHDEERMLRALRRIAAADTRLSVRIGVNQGHVFAGEVGPPYRRTYTVMGDTVNLAARVMTRAAPSEVLCTAGVLERSATYFGREALEPFTVKGKSKPVQAYRLGAPEGRLARDERAIPLVGRTGELAQLRATFDEARAGRGRVVEICGERGSGKTRLWDEAAQTAPDFLRIAVTCVPYESASAYRVAREVVAQLVVSHDPGTVTGVEPGVEPGVELLRRLRELIGGRAPELEASLPLLAGPLELDVPETSATSVLDERFRKQQTDLALAQLIAVASPGPTAIVVEDVQWIDDASADVLRLGEAAVAGLAWVVCATRTDEGDGYRAGGAEVLQLTLPALSDAEATDLVNTACGDPPLRPHEVEMLLRRAGGNPRFLIELAREARAAGSVDHLPESIDGLVSAQLDRLAPEVRRVLRTASVLGPEFELSTMRQLLSMDATDAEPGVVRRTDPAQFNGLLVFEASGRVRFRHSLLRDVAYQSLPYRRRVTLHRRAGAVIESGARADEHAAVLSLHFFIGEDFDAAWRYGRQAADRARSEYANVEAEELLCRALVAARRLGLSGIEVVAAAEALGDVRDRMGVYEGARSAYRTARHSSDDPSTTARLCLKDAWMAERLGAYTQALRWIRRGMRALDAAPSSVSVDAGRAELAVGEAVVRYAQGRARDARSACERAITLARAAGDRSALAHALYLLDFANLALGRLDLAVHSPEALALYEQLGDLSGEAVVANNLGALAYFDGRWDEAIVLYERSQAARRRTGDLVEAATASTNIAEIQIERGELTAAEARLAEALRVYQAAPYLAGVAYATAHLGRVAARAGRAAEAMALLDSARDSYAAVGGRETLEVDGMRAEACVLAGDARGALSIADEALAGARSADERARIEPVMQRSRAVALAQLGRYDNALAAAEAGLRLAREQGIDYDVALAEITVARIETLAGRTPRSTQEAQRLLDRLGVPGVPGLPDWSSR